MVKRQQGIDSDVKGVERVGPEVGNQLVGSGGISHWVEITPLNKWCPQIAQQNRPEGMQGEVRRGNWLLTGAPRKAAESSAKKRNAARKASPLGKQRSPRNLNRLQEKSLAHTRRIQLEPEAQVESTVHCKGYWCVFKSLGYFVWVCVFFSGWEQFALLQPKAIYPPGTHKTRSPQTLP